jgi:hypothetical protein
MHSLGVMQSVRTPVCSPDPDAAAAGWPANSDGGRGAMDLGAMLPPGGRGAIVGAGGAIGADGGGADCATAGDANNTDQTATIAARIATPHLTPKL